MDPKFLNLKLDRHNPAFWKMAIESYATNLKALKHLTSNPPTPHDPAQAEEHENKRHSIRAIIISTVSPDILNLLTVSADPKPKELIGAILTHLQTNTATDHKYLKSEAENLHLNSNMSINDYIAKNTALRARMIASHFPNITDETTSVEFMIDGLRYNPETVEIGPQLLAINSPTIKDFLHHYHRLKSYNMVSPPLLPSTIYSARHPQPGPTSTYTPSPTATLHLQQPLPASSWLSSVFISSAIHARPPQPYR